MYTIVLLDILTISAKSWRNTVLPCLSLLIPGSRSYEQAQQIKGMDQTYLYIILYSLEKHLFSFLWLQVFALACKKYSASDVKRTVLCVAHWLDDLPQVVERDDRFLVPETVAK